MRRILTPDSVRELSRELKKIEKRIKATSRVKVGFPSDAPSYPDGTKVAAVAYWNEYGTTSIPERPFLRVSVRQNMDKYARLFRQAALRILNGYKEQPLLEKIGMVAAQDAKEQIDKTLSPPNSPLTIKLKGSSHPLIDTGHMRQQLTYKVQKRRGGNR